MSGHAYTASTLILLPPLASTSTIPHPLAASRCAQLCIIATSLLSNMVRLSPQLATTISYLPPLQLNNHPPFHSLYVATHECQNPIIWLGLKEESGDKDSSLSRLGPQIGILFGTFFGCDFKGFAHGLCWIRFVDFGWLRFCFFGKLSWSQFVS